MRPLVECVSDGLWRKAADSLRLRVENLKRVTRCSETDVSYDEDGIKKSPCTVQLWHRDVAFEHDEYTCYFRHWFRKEDGKLLCCRFSHLALMPLVRSCIWQGLLAEFVTGRLLGRDAVRLRVEDELENHSNLSDGDMIREVGMLAQDMFGIIKNHLNSTWGPLNRVGLAAAESLVVNMPGLDCRSKRKGWSNRRLRKVLVQRMVDSGIGDLPTRGDQEAFVQRWLSADNGLKQSALASILRQLRNYYDADTGEVVLKPWTRQEINRNIADGVANSRFERTMAITQEIFRKMSEGIPLTGSERKFKSVHKELFPAGSCKKSKIRVKNRKIPPKPPKSSNDKVLPRFKQNVKESIVTNCHNLGNTQGKAKDRQEEAKEMNQKSYYSLKGSRMATAGTPVSGGKA